MGVLVGDDDVGIGVSSEVNVVRDVGERRECLKKALNLSEEGLEAAQVKELGDFLLSSDDLFSLGEDVLGYASLVRHRVDTGDHPPIKQPPRHLPFSQREVVSGLIDDMMKKGVIQPSASAWASPIVLVLK